MELTRQATEYRLKEFKCNGDHLDRFPSAPAWHGKRILEGKQKKRENEKDISLAGRVTDNS